MSRRVVHYLPILHADLVHVTHRDTVAVISSRHFAVLGELCGDLLRCERCGLTVLEPVADDLVAPSAKLPTWILHLVTLPAARDRVLHKLVEGHIAPDEFGKETSLGDFVFPLLIDLHRV